MDRRVFLQASALLPLILSACETAGESVSARTIQSQISDLERASGGRLGVGILDAATGKFTGHRLDERFGMCSTFKLPLAAVILHEISEERLAENQWVAYSESDLLSYAPVTRENVAKGGMTVLELTEATQKTSDNTAANLLLKLIGGPDGYTKKLRDFGDDITRLDRDEPMMNLVLPGDPRDTTTPRAMAKLVGNIFNGYMLNDMHQAMLKQWTIDTKTGLKRLRAGLPADWVVGDKTGTGKAPEETGMVNKHNDVAICWPPGREKPLVIAAYYEADAHYDKLRPRDDAVLATVGKLVAQNYP